MNSDRIKEIQKKTAYPNSISVTQALLQVWNECEQEKKSPDHLLPDGYVEEGESEFQWISVEDRLPENDIEVLVAREKPYRQYLRTAFLRGGKFTSSETAKEVSKITYWMPLPQPPKTNKP